MRLRPHHLLCIQKFTGHGYDPAFTAHMRALVSALAAAPETPVTLVRGCDALCVRCPHGRSGQCESAEKTQALDQGVLDSCGLFYGESLPWSLLAARARRAVLENEAFQKICGCCAWFQLCKDTEVPDDNNEKPL